MSKRVNKFLLLVIVVFLLTIFSCIFYQSYFWRFFVKDGQLVSLVLKKNFFSPIEKELLVEIVRDEKSIYLGLSTRSQLQTESGQHIDGMLFIFPESEIRYFWMKDMQFDIDICWLEDQFLINCTRRALKPDIDEDETQLPIYQSPQAVNMVLETIPDFLPEEFIGNKLYLLLF